VTGADDSVANGSSIVLLCEYRTQRILFAGDAFPHDLVEALANVEGPSPKKLSAFKLPHHGSLKNMTPELMAAVDCPLFLFSSDGTRFSHPDRETVACVIKHGRRSSTPVGLGFNTSSRQNRCWDNPSWSKQLGYCARYGDADGFTLRYLR
jgi:hypothetical protein